MTSSLDQVALLLRGGLGVTFLFAGLEKTLGGTHRVVEYFRSLGIPWPELLGPFVSYLELFGGLALLLGVLTRPVSILLGLEMIVAIVTARAEDALAGPGIAVGFRAIRLEMMLAIAAACLALAGPGRKSVDSWLEGRRRRS